MFSFFCLVTRSETWSQESSRFLLMLFHVRNGSVCKQPPTECWSARDRRNTPGTTFSTSSILKDHRERVAMLSPKRSVYISSFAVRQGWQVIARRWKHFCTTGDIKCQAVEKIVRYSDYEFSGLFFSEHKRSWMLIRRVCSSEFPVSGVGSSSTVQKDCGISWAFWGGMGWG